MMLRYISTLSYFAMQDIKGPFEIPLAAARAAITSFVRVPKIRILAVKTTQRGDSGATLDGVPEVRAGLPSLP